MNHHTLMDERLDAIRDGLDPFLDHLDLNRNYSAHTLRAYARDLRVFIAWLESILEQQGNPDETGNPMPSEQAVAQFFREVPGRYMGYLHHQQLARSGMSRKISALKSYFKFLMKEQYLPPRSLPLSFRQPKPLKKLPDFLTPEEVQTLLDSVTHGTPEDPLPDNEVLQQALMLRNRAMILLLYTSGIRVAELVGLNLDHINKDEAEFRVMGKGSRERLCFMSRETLAALTDYLALWPALSGTDAPPEPNSAVFLNRFGKRITSRSVARMLESVADTAGFTKTVHPHIFRHTFATHLLNHGTDLRVVQELLGHVSIRSAQIYTHLTTERLKRAYMKAHPRAMGRQATKN